MNLTDLPEGEGIVKHGGSEETPDGVEVEGRLDIKGFVGRFGRSFVAWEERVVGEGEIVYLKGGEVVLRRPRCRGVLGDGNKCRKVGTDGYGFLCHYHTSRARTHALGKRTTSTGSEGE